MTKVTEPPLHLKNVDGCTQWRGLNTGLCHLQSSESTLKRPRSTDEKVTDKAAHPPIQLTRYTPSLLLLSKLLQPDDIPVVAVHNFKMEPAPQTSQGPKPAQIRLHRPLASNLGTAANFTLNFVLISTNKGFRYITNCSLESRRRGGGPWHCRTFLRFCCLSEADFGAVDVVGQKINVRSRNQAIRALGALLARFPACRHQSSLLKIYPSTTQQPPPRIMHTITTLLQTNCLSPAIHFTTSIKMHL